MGTPGISHRKRFRNNDRRGANLGPMHLRYGRGKKAGLNFMSVGQVLGLAAAPASLSAVLTWTNIPQADTYTVEKSANGTTGWTVVSSTVPGTASGYTVTGLTAAVIQYFRVSAVNELGAGAVSANASATPTA